MLCSAFEILRRARQGTESVGPSPAPLCPPSRFRVQVAELSVELHHRRAHGERQGEAAANDCPRPPAPGADPRRRAASAGQPGSLGEDVLQVCTPAGSFSFACGVTSTPVGCLVSVASRLPHAFPLSKLALRGECGNACEPAFWLGFLRAVKIVPVVKLLLAFNWYWHLNAEAKDLLKLAI